MGMGQLVTPWNWNACPDFQPAGFSAGSGCPVALLAGQGLYPFLWVEGARKAGVSRIYAVGFVGETDPNLQQCVDRWAWIRVGQLGRLIRQLTHWGVSYALMAGAIRPRNLFDLRPDLRTLWLLSQIKERNAATLFGAVARELEKAGIVLLPATTFLEEFLAREGVMAGPAPSRRFLRDAELGFRLAKEVARLDIGQSIVVEDGVVLAVEAWEGTDETLRRGGALGKKRPILVKVSKPNQDVRFDVPVLGEKTIQIAVQSGIKGIVCEAGSTLLLRSLKVYELAEKYRITLYGMRDKRS